jgi:hypothetical protein
MHHKLKSQRSQILNFTQQSVIFSHGQSRELVRLLGRKKRQAVRSLHSRVQARWKTWHGLLERTKQRWWCTWCSWSFIETSKPWSCFAPIMELDYTNYIPILRLLLCIGREVTFEVTLLVILCKYRSLHSKGWYISYKPLENRILNDDVVTLFRNMFSTDRTLRHDSDVFLVCPSLFNFHHF